MSGLFIPLVRRFKIIVNFNNQIKKHMAAILVLQNNETAAMLLYQTNAMGIQLFSYVNTFFCFNKFAWLLDNE